MKAIFSTDMWRIILFIHLFLYVLSIPAVEQSFPTAPSFTIRDLNNKLISTDSLISQGPLIIVFWSTCCSPCMEEFKTLKKIVTKHKDKNLQVLAISMDAPSKVDRVKQIVKIRRLPFIFAIDKDKRIGQKYVVNVLPCLHFIGTDGRVHMCTRGFGTRDVVKLEKDIHELLVKK